MESCGKGYRSLFLPGLGQRDRCLGAEAPGLAEAISQL